MTDFYKPRRGNSRIAELAEKTTQANGDVLTVGANCVRPLKSDKTRGTTQRFFPTVCINLLRVKSGTEH